RNGVSFSLSPFLPLFPNAEALKAALLEHNEFAGPLFPLNPSPLITPFGAFLLRSSLSELPHLINFVLGTMSL
uniref:sugar transferase n=1 Tax=Leucobacter japonicus TaxID=1461259 RepID=UPI000AB2C0FF